MWGLLSQTLEAIGPFPGFSRRVWACWPPDTGGQTLGDHTDERNPAPGEMEETYCEEHGTNHVPIGFAIRIGVFLTARQGLLGLWWPFLQPRAPGFAAAWFRNRPTPRLDDSMFVAFGQKVSFVRHPPNPNGRFPLSCGEQMELVKGDLIFLPRNARGTADTISGRAGLEKCLACLA